MTATMVRAILDGRKTVTRRIVKPQPEWRGNGWTGPGTGDSPWADGTTIPHGTGKGRCPYGVPGDRLWVKEAWRTWFAYDPTPPSRLAHDVPIHYLADGDAPPGFGRYRHARLMPRWASRLALEVVSVRVERLQEITEQDCIAEGVRRVTKDGHVFKFCVYDVGRDTSSVAWQDMALTARECFVSRWKTINGPDSWASNLWVWRVEFRRAS